MKTFQIIKSAFINIISNKLRSFLTMLGLIIGISSVIVLVGIGNGTNTQVNDDLRSIGTDTIMIDVMNEIGIDYNSLEKIGNEENIKSLAPYKNMFGKEIKNEEKIFKKGNINFTTSDILEVRNINLKKGRNISFIDIENKNKVCLIGSDIKTTLFGFTDCIGKTIKVDGDKYTVVGLLEKQGETLGTNVDNLIIIPFSLSDEFGIDSNITKIYIKVKDESKLESTKALLKTKLKTENGILEDEISIVSQDSTIDKTNKINNTLSLLLGGIASISLIVGGIGVMNVMLVSVTERTKEIGIRKALGAKKGDILMQFLIEAIIISIIGGIFGIIIGIGFGNFTNKIGFSFILSHQVIYISFIASSIVGIIFGIFPAYRAAKLNPIDALRYE